MSTRKTTNSNCAIDVAVPAASLAFRMPVQWVNRPNDPTNHALHDFRGFSGQIAGGIIKVGQKVMVLPSGQKSTVKKIWTLGGELMEAFCPQSVTLILEHDLDVSRVT